MKTGIMTDYEVLFWKHFNMDVDRFETLVGDLANLSGIDALMDAFWTYRGRMGA